MSFFRNQDRLDAERAAEAGHAQQLRAFRSCVRKGLAIAAGTVLHKTASVTIEGAGERRKLFTISTEAVDRERDTINLQGWQLDAYRKNPVVLWGHNSYMPPIGRTVDIGTVAGALKAVVEFVPADMPLVGEEADMIFRMCDAGFLSACSVGFRPLKFETAKDRMDDDDWWPPVNFIEQELLEWSVVTVPANGDATIDDEGRAAAIEAAKQAREADAAAKALLDARRRVLRAACY